MIKANQYSFTNNFNYYVSLHEGQMFDSRQDLLTLLTTTIDNYNEGCKGSVIANYIEFVEFLYKDNKIIGVKALDKVSNKTIEIKAKLVVNCAGIRADNLFNKDDPQYNKVISASKGTHLVMKNNIFGISEGLMIPKTSDNRIIFILPYQDHILIGKNNLIQERRTKCLRRTFLHALRKVKLTI
jgi:glycerol-3-phosphate dehydrogenase